MMPAVRHLKGFENIVKACCCVCRLIMGVQETEHLGHEQTGKESFSLKG